MSHGLSLWAFFSLSCRLGEVQNAYLLPSSSSLPQLQNSMQGPMAHIFAFLFPSLVCQSLPTRTYFDAMSGSLSCVCLLHRKLFVELYCSICCKFQGSFPGAPFMLPFFALPQIFLEAYYIPDTVPMR